MISLFPFHTVATVIAIIYALFIAAATLLFNVTGLATFAVVFKGATAFSFILFVFIAFGWRALWAKYPILNRWVYPDLNGKWKVTIHWCWENQTGTKEADAYIRQNFVDISIELISDESESETLMVKSKQDSESKRPIIFYIYRNESKQGVASPQPPHKGAAILKISPTDTGRLEGNYFTDRATKGHYILERVGEIP